MHKHKCGHTSPYAVLFQFSPYPSDGCGHVWENEDHDGPFQPDEEQLWRSVHTCPACGKGPWSTKWSDEDAAKAAQQQAQASTSKRS